MGTLRLDVSDTALRADYDRLIRRLLERGDDMPELDEAPRLEGTYDPQVLALCARNWRIRMRQEHHSSAVFAGMLPQFMAAEAPVDVKMCLLRASMDELRHAALCADVVRVLGHDPALETSLEAEPMAEHPGVPADEVALRNLFFVGCLSETVAVALLTEERGMCKEPWVAKVLRQLTADETLHARMGWIWLRDRWPHLSADARERTQEYLAFALAWYEQCMVRATPPARIPASILEQARAIGFADCDVSRELFYETVEHVILPQLDDLGLHARKAWRDRRLMGDAIAGQVTLTGAGA
ncbi:MAG: diiron oxygenase [Myxococcales bacterium]|jgi:hypothetical protein|nr:diiron oxygenase [Myxococcales bacterium]